MIATNNTPGPQTVLFAIPQSEWWHQTNMAVLRIETFGVEVLDDDTTLDFSSQTAFTGDTNPDGPEVGAFGIHTNFHLLPIVYLSGNHGTVKGLGTAWNRAAVEITGGSGNRVIGCNSSTVEVGWPVPGGPTDTLIGGTGAGEGNVLRTVRIGCHATDTVIVGNKLENIWLSGSEFCARPERTRIGGPTPEERNVISGFGSFGPEGVPEGQGIHIDWAKDTVIEGNYIGVTPDGAAVAPNNGPLGIWVSDSMDTIIRGNLIAGTRKVGINHYAGQVAGLSILLAAIGAHNDRVTIQGNKIGTDASGLNPLLTHSGIRVHSGTGNYACRNITIGGRAPREGNTIAFTETFGVGISYPAISTEVSGNSIHSNGALGIDLGPLAFLDGVTPNDSLDSDTGGGNEYQNFPRLAFVSRVGGAWFAKGVLRSEPNRPYRVEVFSSTEVDPTGYGQGERYLGEVTVMTDPMGRATFMLPLLPGARQDDWFSATATELGSLATSEFSRAIQAGPREAFPR
ncbi:hypothetical protein [Saltatorellus ferox]|uniref:hypothetical protein n=1 Tax=Saltatorellus ferox TaxID=2528018 RepID=UPI003AF3E9D5